MSWHESVITSIGRPAAAGTIGLVVGVFGFGLWAATAPLEGAVMAQGSVVSSGRNKAVQHLEGGIVKTILVKEGEHVETGQTILLLDATTAEVKRNRVLAQLNQLQAVEARAITERDNGKEIDFPKSLLATSIRFQSVLAVIEDQRAEFLARLERFTAERGILAKQIAALDEEITGLEAQKTAVSIQLDLIREEKADAQQLLREKLTRKSAVLELLRTEARLIGQQGRLTSEIAKARQAIAESQQQIQRLRARRLEEATAKLAEVRLQRSDLLEQMRSAQDVLDRIQVQAPATGTIINLAKTGSGAVIVPGEMLMEIVPDGVDLLVEAHIRPSDIDQVRLGQDARLVFSALNQRNVPPVDGNVVHVSADSIIDQRTGESYYLARLAIDPDIPAEFDRNNIGPGQPVEAFITTGERTFFAYLLEPIASTLRRSLREN